MGRRRGTRVLTPLRGAWEPLACVGVALLLAGSLPLSCAQDDFEPLPGVQGAFSQTLNATVFPTVAFSFDASIANYVTDWNLAVQWAHRAADLSRYGTTSPRAHALLHLAQWQTLRMNGASTTPLDSNCVVAQVSQLLFNNLFSQYNSQANAMLDLQMQNFTSDEQQACHDFVKPIVRTMLSARLDDGAADAATFVPDGPGAPPGRFQSISDAPDLFSNYANGTVFLTNETVIAAYTTDQGPPSVDSADYNVNFAGYAQYGSANSNDSIRSSYQTASAYFWYATNGTSGTSGQWNQVALTLMPETLSLEETAEILAKLNVASWDSFILVAKAKYQFLRWRPITAVREGTCYVRNTSGCHQPDPSFVPLLMTPNTPVYPSWPGSYAGVSEEILSSLAGNYSFSIGSESTVPSVGRAARPRRYNSLTQASLELCSSRIYGGIEAPNDALAGRAYGLQVAAFVDQNFELLDPLSPLILPPFATLAKDYGLNPYGR